MATTPYWAGNITYNRQKYFDTNQRSVCCPLRCLVLSDVVVLSVVWCYLVVSCCPLSSVVRFVVLFVVLCCVVLCCVVLCCGCVVLWLCYVVLRLCCVVLCCVLCCVVLCCVLVCCVVVVLCCDCGCGCGCVVL